MFHADDYFPPRLALVLASHTEALSVCLSRPDPPAATINIWLQQALQRGDWVLSDGAFEYGFDPANPAEFRLSVPDQNAKLLATSGPNPGFGPVLQALIGQAQLGVADCVFATLIVVLPRFP